LNRVRCQQSKKLSQDGFFVGAANPRSGFAGTRMHRGQTSGAKRAALSLAD
jgi:hypothetical protein